MTKSLDDRKYRIIQELINTEDEELINDLESRIAQKPDKPDKPVGSEVWDLVMKPMRKSISVEELALEQGYVPIEKDTFFQLAQDLSIEEDIDELLAQL